MEFITAQATLKACGPFSWLPFPVEPPVDPPVVAPPVVPPAVPPPVVMLPPLAPVEVAEPGDPTMLLAAEQPAATRSR
jgi:hypothetical protein